MSNVNGTRHTGVMPGRGVNLSGSKPKSVKSTLRQLLNYLGKSKKSLIVVFSASLIGTLCGLASTYAIRPLLNSLEATLKGENTIDTFFTNLVTFLAILGSIYLIQVLMSWLQSQLMVQISQNTVHRLRKDLYDRMLHMPVGYHDKRTHGEIMSHFTNDIDLLSDSITNSMSSLVSSSSMLVGTILMMIYLSWQLAIITLIALPIFTFLINRIVAMSRKYFRRQQEAIAKLNGFVEETMEGQQVNLLFNHESSALETFDQLNTNYRTHAMRAQSWSGLMIPFMMNLNAVNYALIASVGGYLSVVAGLSVGTLGAFVNSTRQFSRPLNEIAMQYTSIQAGLAAAERIFEVLKQPIETDDDHAIELNESQGLVRFENVDFAYDPQKPVLHDVSFYAKPGQKIAIVGSTGAGKTTITNLISRFYDIPNGNITIDGHNIKEYTRSSLRKQMAMVLQDTHLFEGTILDNICYGKPYASDEACIEAAKLAYAHSFINRLPEGYHTKLRFDGSELSQGQRQLLNIARALLANPKILILDEATSSIDTRTESNIEKGMDRLMEGRTTFVIAHRLSTVRHANAILVLENGVILERGDHAELMRQNGRYASLVRGQSELT
ncbi:MAG: ABC transporter ATP-binding protein [Erysipelotrichaceae bacterium]